MNTMILMVVPARHGVGSHAEAADDGVRGADREEVRAPVARRVGRELHVPALVRHAGDDEPNPGPRVEPPAETPEWKVIRWARKRAESESDTEAAARSSTDRVRSSAIAIPTSIAVTVLAIDHDVERRPGRYD
jgi:hypothetical protein